MKVLYAHKSNYYDFSPIFYAIGRRTLKKELANYSSERGNVIEDLNGRKRSVYKETNRIKKLDSFLFMLKYFLKEVSQSDEGQIFRFSVAILIHISIHD